jgi:uncharacterized protein YndB with AHSA1/START domain
MPELQFETTIHRPSVTVFGLIADLPNYGKWLPSSSLFGSVTEYSELPVRAGTQYVDKGPSSRMIGMVTEFEPPTRISFRQMTTSLFGSLTVEVRYSLAVGDDDTHLTRRVTVTASGGYQLAQPMIVRAIRQENERILATMKAYLESDAGKVG